MMDMKKFYIPARSILQAGIGKFHTIAPPSIERTENPPVITLADDLIKLSVWTIADGQVLYTCHAGS